MYTHIDIFSEVIFTPKDFNMCFGFPPKCNILITHCNVSDNYNHLNINQIQLIINKLTIANRNNIFQTSSLIQTHYLRSHVMRPNRPQSPCHSHSLTPNILETDAVRAPYHSKSMRNREGTWWITTHFPSAHRQPHENVCLAHNDTHSFEFV